MTAWTPERIRARADELGPWFHNLTLGGVRTAPGHFLHDFPNVKWQSFRAHVPEDLSGRSVLDVGCNGGFYSLEMKRRGAARVLGIDHDERYLAQARFAAEVEGLDVEFRLLSVYDVASLGERFDLVLFLGVLYHLRHPLLALDLLHAHATRDLLVFQSLQRGAEAVCPVAPDYDFFAPAPFEEPGFPRLHFVEHSYAHDPTNWWIPNHAASAAMLRSAGYEVLHVPEPEIFVCRHVAGGHAPVFPAREP